MVSLLLLKQMFRDSGMITWDSALLESLSHFCYTNTFACKYVWAFCTVFCVTICTIKCFFIKHYIQMKASMQGTTQQTCRLAIFSMFVTYLTSEREFGKWAKYFIWRPFTLLVSDTSSGPLAFLLPLTAVAAHGIGRLNFAASFSSGAECKSEYSSISTVSKVLYCIWYL